MKRSAFTLAEVLIVIGIIGVVAALTIPNLNQSIGNKETITRVKKSYSTLAEAFDRATAVYGPMDTWNCTSGNPCYADRINRFLKVTKECTSTDKDCIYSSLNGSTFGRGFRLSDGMSVMYTVMGNFSKTCTISAAYVGTTISDICLHLIEVDIDGGLKAPNTNGKDTFYFAYSNSLGIIPYCGASTTEAYMSNIFGTGKSCAAKWVLDFDNMDYLEADTTGKCTKNPSIILDGVTNTSCK